VIEEMLRIYGYNNIEIGNHVNSTLNFVPRPDSEKVQNIISDMLVASGFTEIMCNSLTPAAWFTDNPDFSSEKLVMLANPLSADLNAMRQSLLYGGLSSIAWNINRQQNDLKLFEFGNCYFYNNRKTGLKRVESYSEKKDLGIFITGLRSRQSWNNPAVPSDFFLIKSSVEMILSRAGIRPESLSKSETGRKYYSESILYSYNNQAIAETGRLAASTLKKFDIGQDVFYAHVEWDMLMKTIRNHEIQYRELPKYPSVRRDLALLVDRSVRFGKIRDLAFRAEKHVLKEVSLFDVYESESLGENKKSYAVSFILQDEERTMTDKSIDKVMNNFIRIFQQELDAQIR
jgi:phenylalanyl-tRNA synthetase beta chain